MRVLLSRLIGLFRRRDARLDEEIHTHLDALTDQYSSHGMSSAQARVAAMRAFGGVIQTKEQYRDQRGLIFVESVVQDVWHALRQFRRNPGFAAAAILTLAIGVGASTTIFSVADAVLFRPLPYTNPGELVIVHETVPTFGNITVNAAHFLVWREQARSFVEMALLGAIRVNMTGRGEPQSISGARVSSTFFSMLGVRPQIGRDFLTHEDQPGRDRVILLENEFWTSHFAGDPEVVGRTVTLDGESYEIVGVLPRDFRFPAFEHLIPLPSTSTRPRFWKPFGVRDEERNPVGGFNYICVARLRPGVSLAEAALDVERQQSAIAAQLPQKIDLHSAIVPMHIQVIGRASRGVLLLLGAVVVVLVIGCVNLTNLLLVRTTARRHEMVLRSMLGAGRVRLARQILLESVTLCGIGGLCGFALAYAGVRSVPLWAPANIPRLDEVAIDARVMVIVLAVVVATALLTGCVAALQSIKTNGVLNSRTALTGGSGGALRSALVSTEVGLSVVSLVVAGLLVHSLVNVLTVEKGFNTDRLITMTFTLPLSRYPTLERRSAFLRPFIERIQAVPGVVAVGLSNQLPLTGTGPTSALSVDGTTLPLLERPIAEVRAINEDYFRTWQIPLEDGRLFSAADGTRNVVLVSEAAAQRAWPGENPLGKRLRFGANANGPLFEVIGVVGDVRSTYLDLPPPLTAYVPYWQRIQSLTTSVAVRSSADMTMTGGRIRTILRELDAELPVPVPLPMDVVVGEATAGRRFQLRLVLLFALTAVLLAGVGIYGIMAYAVLRRRQEIGVRLALGADPARIRRTVLMDAVRVAGRGLVVGVPLAIAAAVYLESTLFEVAPYDFASIISAILVVVTAAVAATFLPARRAARVDPTVALRCE